MADEVLSPAELEALLSSLDFDTAVDAHAANTGVRAVRSRPAAPARPAAAAKRAEAHSGRTAPYDVKRPQKLSPTAVRALETLHGDFCRAFGVALSAQLRSVVEVKLARVEQLTYSEFVFSLDNPTCFNLLRSRPVTGFLALDVQPSILYPIIDRLLGGGREKSPIVRRPLTEIELRLAARITTLFVEELVKAWRGVAGLELLIERIESNPQAAEAAAPNEVVAVVVMAVAINDARGMLSLCLPWPWLCQLIDRLAGGSRATTGGHGEASDSPHVALVAQLAKTTVAAGDLRDLGVGDIITTDQHVDAQVAICVNGVTRFRGSLGAQQGRKAVQIDDVVDPPAAG